jgi:NAD(P)-dependent dehydrogenase (short-subunit alcohol dehydrogenase family)
MTSTSHSEFGASTDGLNVAAAFPASIKGRSILITGINKLGLGYTAAEAFASQGPRCLILAGRSTTKVQECVDSLRSHYPGIDYRILQFDLSSQKSVRAAAAEVLDWADVPTINLVINNAGVMNIQKHTLSEDGIELHLSTNFVGHFLFTNLIMPKIIAAAKDAPHGSTRIINISSIGVATSPLRVSDVNWEKPASQLPETERPNFAMMRAAGLDVSDEISYFPLAAYGQSKTANVLHSVGLNQRLYEKYGILSIAVHPGEVESELQRHTDAEWFKKVEELRQKVGIKMKSQQQGAGTTLVAALDPKLGKPGSDGHGQFLSDCQISKVPPHAVDQGDAEKLWEMAEAWTGEISSL